VKNGGRKVKISVELKRGLKEKEKVDIRERIG